MSRSRLRALSVRNTAFANLGDPMRPISLHAAVMAAAATGLLASALIATAKAADAPPFIGTWSLDPADCSAGQESENAPLVIGKERYDQHESHCAFKSVENENDGDWKIAADCTVEGSSVPYDFTLTVSGDTLTFTDTGGPRDFLRCK